MGALTGKRAVVTGAGSGIGRATARAFAEQGAAVVIGDLNADGLEATRAEVAAAGGQVHAIAGDVATDRGVIELVEASKRVHGGLDVLMANAGIAGKHVPFFDLDESDWDEVLRVNLIGTFLAVKHASLTMKAQGHGSIVCTASVAGLRSGAGSTAYSASKAGVISLVQTAANQLYGSGVRVNAICPGLIETGMTAPVYAYARARGREQKIGQLNPTARGGEPHEIANLAVFLASDQSSYVNGQAIAADGGLSSSHPVVPGRLA